MAHEAPLSMEFSKQEYWNGLLFPSPGDLPNPGIEPWSPELQADALPLNISVSFVSYDVGSSALQGSPHSHPPLEDTLSS